MRGTFKAPSIQQIRSLRQSIGWRPRTAQKWVKILKNSRYIYSVYDGKTLVGMARMVEDGVMCMIYDFAVRKEYRKQGIGTKIMSALVAKIKDKNYTSIGLFTDDSAVKFYKKLGFELANGMQLKKYMH